MNKGEHEEKHEEKLRACAAYFKEREAFLRVFQVMRKKWRRYGRVSGMIKLEFPSIEERKALEGFFASDLSGEAICFSMREWENALEQTRFFGVSVEELLGAYFQEDLVTNQEEKKRSAKKKEQFFQELQKIAGSWGEDSWGEDSWAFRWICCAVREKKFGYHLIASEYGKDPEWIKSQVEHVCHAMAVLEQEQRLRQEKRQQDQKTRQQDQKTGQGIRLAVLGVRVTKNPHEFDRDTLGGKLLIQALSCVHEGMACKSAEDILMLYYASGIKPDDISSFTTAYGIHLYTEEGEHPAYRGFLEMGEPFVITLSNLGRIKSVQARSNKVYAVENQMVFSHLCESLQGKEVPLICTSGQVKTASWMLMDLLWENGNTIYYCGDLDPEGIGIAEKILWRAGKSACLWHMSGDDYRLSMSEEPISAESLSKLEKVSHPALAEVKAEVLNQKKAGYQEQLMELMLEDMNGRKETVNEVG